MIRAIDDTSTGVENHLRVGRTSIDITIGVMAKPRVRLLRQPAFVRGA